MRNKTGLNKNGLASAQSQIYRQELQGEKGFFRWELQLVAMVWMQSKDVFNLPCMMICTNLSKHLKTVGLHIKPKYLSPFENLLLQAPISTQDQLAGVCWSPFPLQSLNSWVLHVSIPPFALLVTLFTHSQDLPGPAGLKVCSFYSLYWSRQTPTYCQPDTSHLLSFWVTQWSQFTEAGSLVRLLSF